MGQAARRPVRPAPLRRRLRNPAPPAAAAAAAWRRLGCDVLGPASAARAAVRRRGGRRVEHGPVRRGEVQQHASRAPRHLGQQHLPAAQLVAPALPNRRGKDALFLPNLLRQRRREHLGRVELQRPQAEPTGRPAVPADARPAGPVPSRCKGRLGGGLHFQSCCFRLEGSGGGCECGGAAVGGAGARGGSGRRGHLQRAAPPRLGRERDRPHAVQLRISKRAPGRLREWQGRPKCGRQDQGGKAPLVQERRRRRLARKTGAIVA
mmetsp:Transcript_10210/g.20825  ORF Transcript_10210/g.20825 Transcript_10210/m.20825 type:complete len:264 (+) Transcript_10210:750-1541(+)